jgi:formylglycine-generating enzyme required for sulfatase activity
VGAAFAQSRAATVTENGLGMRFLPLPGSPVLVSIWETRVQDYAAFAKATQRAWPDPGFAQTPSHPAVNVSWHDARDFCAWLTDCERAAGRLKADRIYRLPTDAEWSLAAGLDGEKGATPEEKGRQPNLIFPWSSGWPPAQGAGNFADEATKKGFYAVIPKIAGYDDGYEATAPVGCFAVNRAGLYDVGGNVLEWCADFLNGHDGNRVIRDSCFLNDKAENLRLTARDGLPAEQVFVFVGFRVVEAPAALSAPVAAAAQGVTDQRASVTAALLQQMLPVLLQVAQHGKPDREAMRKEGRRMLAEMGLAMVNSDLLDKIQPLLLALAEDPKRAKGTLEDYARRMLAETGVVNLVLQRMERPPAPGETWIAPLHNLALVPMPAGSFQMGSMSTQFFTASGQDNSGRPSMRPVTTVRFSKSFWLGKTEVTQAQWREIMGTTVAEQRVKHNETEAGLAGEGDNYPMYFVDWDEAMEFCRKLTERERDAGRLPAGYLYSLPSEAQWEYGARAGDTSDVPANLPAIAWYGDNSGEKAHEVAQKQPNAWGLYDIIGNVSEICLDRPGTYPGGTVTDYLGSDDTSEHCTRGISYYSSDRYALYAFRSGDGGGTVSNDGGFRVALTPQR